MKNTKNTDYYYYKHNVDLKEYKIHKYIYDLNIVNTPKIYSYDKTNKILKMQNINEMNLSDMYGEKEENISDYLFNKIREIILSLYMNNIEYLDITGYNFIEKNNKIWIIDFEHANFNKKINNKYITDFIEGVNKWNNDFL
jgi:tRNA A-37 threonylcarbamoyl transferase component Bud32